MRKEITENAMKDEIELHVFFVVADKMVFRASYCATINISFHYSISLLLHFRLSNAVCRRFHFQSLSFLPFCIWMDANLNSNECVFWGLCVSVWVCVRNDGAVFMRRLSHRCRRRRRVIKIVAHTVDIIMLMGYQIDLLCCWKSNILDYILWIRHASFLFNTSTQHTNRDCVQGIRNFEK